MKITCEVIKDILPLYTEEMVSRDTKALVEEHVADCAECGKLLAECKQQTSVPKEVKLESLNIVKKGIRSRRSITVLTVVTLLLTFLAAVFIHLTTPVWLTAEEAIESVEQPMEGRLKIWYSDKVSGRIGFGGIFCFTVPGETLFERKLPAGMNEASYEGYDEVVYNEKSFWYYGIFANEEPTLLWGDSQYAPSFPADRIGYGLKYAFFATSGVGSALLAIGIMFFKRKGKQIVIKLCTPFLSFAASSLFVTWGRFLTFEDLFWKLSCSLTLAVLVWMSVLCCWKLYDYHKNDGI